MSQSSSPTLPPGLFIVIEGIDGTGKSTQASRLGEWFEKQGREVVLSREPTDGPWGRKLRESAATGRLSPQDELEYFLNDRRQHVEEKIKPALAAGKVVILDRYYFSTMAYQGARGFDPAEIRRMNEEFAPVPDLLLILDLDVDAAHGRIGHRGDSANEFEKNGEPRTLPRNLPLAGKRGVHEGGGFQRHPGGGLRKDPDCVRKRRPHLTKTRLAASAQQA
jgi:dTMP kinase